MRALKAAAVAAMRTLGIGGLAVTTPHKADVAAAVDAVDPAATALRSVNTVVLHDDPDVDSSQVDALRAAGVEFVRGHVSRIVTDDHPARDYFEGDKEAWVALAS